MSPLLRRILLSGIAVAPMLVILAVGGVTPALRQGRALHAPATAGEDSLRREIAFREAQLATARSSRMALHVDPARGLVELRHGAVVLRRVRAEEIRVSPGIRFAHPDSTIRDTVAARVGLIPTDPIRHVAAPADTSEANRAPTDLPVDDTPAYATVLGGQGLLVRLDPSDATAGARLRGRLYRIAERLSGNVRGLLTGSWPEVVTLRLPDADARALYRALSDGDPVIVRSGPSGPADSSR